MYEFTPMRPSQGSRKRSAGHSIPHSASGRANKAHDLINKVLAFCAALVVIWAITHFMTSNSVPDGMPSNQIGETAAASIPPAQTVNGQTPSLTGVRSENADLNTEEEASIWSGGNIAALVMLLGGIVLAYVLRRRTGRTEGGRVLMKTISHMPVTGDQQLRLVTCADEVLLLSVAPTHTTLLKSYPVSAFRKKQAGQLTPVRPITSVKPITSARPISSGRRKKQPTPSSRYDIQPANQQINSRKKASVAPTTPDEPSFSRVLRDYFGQRAEKYLRDEEDWQ